ncbi:hypothetical protein GGX14DRAFT_448700, partial [Mycena pura]
SALCLQLAPALRQNFGSFFFSRHRASVVLVFFSSGARKKKNKKERERRTEEVQPAQTPVSPPLPSSAPTPHDNADTSGLPRHTLHPGPRLPVSTPRDWSTLRADDPRDRIPHPWRTIRNRKRRVRIPMPLRNWEPCAWLPGNTMAEPPSPPPPSVSTAPPRPARTLPMPPAPGVASTNPWPAGFLKTMPPPLALPPLVPPRMSPDREHGLRRLRAMFTSPELRAAPTPTVAGTACSPFAVALGPVFSRPDDILSGISLATWGMPNDERREFLRYLPPDQLLIFATLTHMFVSEPDLAPFLLPPMADYVEDFVERCEEVLG